MDDVIAKAEKAGGKTDVAAKQEMGDSMYERSFEDLDGHVWEVVWMDMKPCGEMPETAEVLKEEAKEG